MRHSFSVTNFRTSFNGINEEFSILCIIIAFPFPSNYRKRKLRWLPEETNLKASLSFQHLTTLNAFSLLPVVSYCARFVTKSFNSEIRFIEQSIILRDIRIADIF